MGGGGQGRLDAGYYRSRDALRGDLTRMTSNCILYNECTTIFYREVLFVSACLCVRL